MSGSNIKVPVGHSASEIIQLEADPSYQSLLSPAARKRFTALQRFKRILGPERYQEWLVPAQEGVHEGEKECRKCNELLPRSEFHYNAVARDGLASWCKSCVRALKVSRRLPK